MDLCRRQRPRDLDEAFQLAHGPILLVVTNAGNRKRGQALTKHHPASIALLRRLYYKDPVNLSEDAIFQRALLELYESANLTAVPDRILEATQILVPGEVLAFTEVDYRTGRVGGRAWPEEYFKVGFATLQD